MLQCLVLGKTGHTFAEKWLTWNMHIADTAQDLSQTEEENNRTLKGPLFCEAQHMPQFSIPNIITRYVHGSHTVSPRQLWRKLLRSMEEDIKRTAFLFSIL